MKNTNTIIRSRERLAAMLGVDNSVQTGEIAYQPQKRPVLGYFSQREINNFPGLDKRTAMYADNPYQFIGYLQNTAENNSKIIQDISFLRYMAPEITKAERILTSSIMSPNDMQDDRIPLEMDPLSEIDEQTQEELLKYITDFYNNDMELGIKVNDWLGETMFRKGSKAIMILPKAVLRSMSNAQDIRNGLGLPPDEANRETAMEDFNRRVSMLEDRAKDLDEHAITISLESWEQKTSKVSTLSNNEELTAYVYGEIMRQDPDCQITLEHMAKLSSYARDGVAKFVKQHRASIEIGRNPFAIKQVADQAREFVSQAEKDIYAVYRQGIDDTAMINIPEDNSGTHATDMAVWVELPAESVIPVCVPGSESTHLGYFVLVGENGVPIGSNTQDMAHNSVTGVIRSNARACMDDKKLSEVLGANTMHRDIAVSAIFGVAIKNILQTELGKQGLQNMSALQYNAISSCVFSHIAMDQQIRLIFVPASMMAYYAFFYRPDGTGKSIIEDCSTILSLRTTLITANILSQMRNAIDRRKLTLDFTGKTMNPEAAMEMAKELYVRKQFVGFSNDPTIAATNMALQGFTIQPKGIPGLPDNMDVQVEAGQPSHTPVEKNELLETLTNMFIDFLIVPHSALNKLSEDEFAKTVATNHLYFCNQLRSFQREVNEKTTKLIRTHMRFSYGLQQDLVKILTKYTTRKNQQGTPEAVLAQADCSALLQKVICSVRAKLPPPNMAVSKAQFDEIKSFVESLDGLMNDVFNDEMIPNSDISPDGIMKLIKSHYKAKLAREYISSVGSHKVFDIPELEDFDDKDLHDMIQQFINLMKGVKDHYKSFKQIIKDEDDDGGYGGGGSDGGGDDFSNDDSGSSEQSFSDEDNEEDKADETGDASDDNGADAALDKLDKLAGS